MERLQSRLHDENHEWSIFRLTVDFFLGAPLRCALAFGRVELFIFNSLAARMNPCPDTSSRP